MTELSLQTFTIRNNMKKDKDIVSSLETLQRVGIKNLELAYVNWDDHTISLIADTCKRLSINVVSSQIKLGIIKKNYDDIIKYHHMLNCKYMSISVLPTKYILQGEKGIIGFSKHINQLGKKLLEDNIHLLHHHHHMEYANYGSEKGIDLIMEYTNPKYMNLTLDTYWTQVGGGNTLDILDQYGHRIKVIHLRDVVSKLNLWKRDFETKDCVMGTGNMNIPAIVKKAKQHNIPYIAIELDSKHAFNDIKASLSYYNSIVLS